MPEATSTGGFNSSHSASSSPARSVPGSPIERLVARGFTIAESTRTLEFCSGDVNVAANMLEKLRGQQSKSQFQRRQQRAPGDILAAQRAQLAPPAKTPKASEIAQSTAPLVMNGGLRPVPLKPDVQVPQHLQQRTDETQGTSRQQLSAPRVQTPVSPPMLASSTALDGPTPEPSSGLAKVPPITLPSHPRDVDTAHGAQVVHKPLRIGTWTLGHNALDSPRSKPAAPAGGLFVCDMRLASPQHSGRRSPPRMRGADSDRSGASTSRVLPLEVIEREMAAQTGGRGPDDA